MGTEPAQSRYRLAQALLASGEGADSRRCTGRPHASSTAPLLSPWLRAGSAALVASRFGGLLPKAGPTGTRQGWGRKDDSSGSSTRLLPKQAPASKGSHDSFLFISQSASSGRLPAGPHP